MASANKIMVLTTGNPAPAVEREVGSFASMVRRAIGPSWPGQYVDADARAEPLPPAVDGTWRPAAVVITGSPDNAYHHEPWMVRTEAWLRRLVATGVPIFGICFGHQLLTQAFGGTVHENPRGREVGTVAIEPVGADPLFGGRAEPFAGNCIHDDTVRVPPTGAITLARSALDDHHCLRFAEACYGVQFHPEFDARVMRSYIRARASSIQAQGLSPERLLDEADDAVAGRQILRSFIERFAR